MLAGLVFCSGFSEGRRGGQQQFATQTLRIHLLGLGQYFSGYAPVTGQITGSTLKAFISSRKVFELTGPALSRINSVIVSAQTVHQTILS